MNYGGIQMMSSRQLSPWALLVSLGLLSGCLGKPEASGGKSSTKTGNSGPSTAGVIEGTITISGDPALIMDADAQKIPLDCDVARTLYPPLFREGPGRTLADAFVGVTGYKESVAQKTEPLNIEAKGCAFSSRTYALSKAQHLMVKSMDNRAYVPNLFGSRGKSALVALPNGEAVPVFHRGPGQYALVNDMQIFTQATVLVVDYSTFDVTGLDGKYRIEGIPAGSVDLSAFLPAAQVTVSRKVEVRAKQTTHVDLKLTFNVEAFKAARQPKRAPTTGTSPAEPAP